MYGTTENGGSNNLGTVYKINKDGSGFSVVKAFDGFAVDGNSPYGGLMQARDGMLYGTTQNGGAGGGVIFRLNADGLGYRVLKRLDDENRID